MASPEKSELVIRNIGFILIKLSLIFKVERYINLKNHIQTLIKDDLCYLYYCFWPMNHLLMKINQSYLISTKQLTKQSIYNGCPVLLVQDFNSLLSHVNPI